MNPDHTITGNWKENLKKFGYCSILRGATPEDNERLRVELEKFLVDHNKFTKLMKIDRPTLFLTEESMLFSIHPKSPVTSADLKKKK